MSKPEEAGQHLDTPYYDHATGGWGVKALGNFLAHQNASFAALSTLVRQNKTGGHMCTSCAWTKLAPPHLFEFCENAPVRIRAGGASAW